MAGKNTYFRLLTIDSALKTGRKYNWKQLADICEHKEDIRPSERTIQGDIGLLKNKFGAPIPTRCEGGLWYYTDTNFSINNNPIFVNDVRLLQEISVFLNQLPSPIFTNELAELIQKTENYLDLEIGAISSAPVILFEKIKTNINAQFLKLAYDAILAKTVLTLEYQPFHKAVASKIDVSPYLLKQYNNRWFLIAQKYDKGRLSVYGLERIKAIKIKTDIAYQGNLLDLSSQYDKDIIGVSCPIDAEKETIRLKVNAQRTPYFVTKPLHPSQKLVEQLEDDSSIFELVLIINFEFRAKLLSHGAAIEVLAPDTLRQTLQAEIEVMTAMYSKS